MRDTEQTTPLRVLKGTAPARGERHPTEDLRKRLLVLSGQQKSPEVKPDGPVEVDFDELEQRNNAIVHLLSELTDNIEADPRDGPTVARAIRDVVREYELTHRLEQSAHDPGAVTGLQAEITAHLEAVDAAKESDEVYHYGHDAAQALFGQVYKLERGSGDTDDPLAMQKTIGKIDIATQMAQRKAGA